jgi:hypothetical protein
MIKARDILITLTKKYRDWDDVYTTIQKREPIDSFDSYDGNFLTILDDGYPANLKNGFKPPFVLEYDGDLNELKRNDYTFIIGENDLGLDENNLIRVVKKDNTILVGKKLILKSFCGLNELMRTATFLSENLFINKKFSEHKHDVSLIVDNALVANKDIFVRPTIEKSFNNSLIKSGAYLVDCLEDFDFGGTKWKKNSF